MAITTLILGIVGSAGLAIGPVYWAWARQQQAGARHARRGEAV